MSALDFPDVLAAHPGHTQGGCHMYILVRKSTDASYTAILDCTGEDIGSHEQARAKGWIFHFFSGISEAPRWCPACREKAEAILALKALTQDP